MSRGPQLVRVMPLNTPDEPSCAVDERAPPGTPRRRARTRRRRSRRARGSGGRQRCRSTARAAPRAPELTSPRTASTACSSSATTPRRSCAREKAQQQLLDLIARSCRACSASCSASSSSRVTRTRARPPCRAMARAAAAAAEAAHARRRDAACALHRFFLRRARPVRDERGGRGRGRGGGGTMTFDQRRWHDDVRPGGARAPRRRPQAHTSAATRAWSAAPLTAAAWRPFRPISLLAQPRRRFAT